MPNGNKIRIKTPPELNRAEFVLQMEKNFLQRLRFFLGGRLKDGGGDSQGEGFAFSQGMIGEKIHSLGLSVSQIADLCGFRDIYYFSKVFKNETGLTPLQWRKKN